MFWPRMNKPKSPDAATVMKRAIILKHLFVKALAIPPPEVLAELTSRSNSKIAFLEMANRHSCEQIEHLQRSELWGEMEETERDLIRASPIEVRQQALANANWLSESIMCLLWALNYIPKLPPYDRPVNPELTNAIPAESAEILIPKAKLRPLDMITKQRDLAELWHWRSRTRRLLESGEMPRTVGDGLTLDQLVQQVSAKAAENGDIPAAIEGDFPALGKPYRALNEEEFSMATSIAMERHHAFNWLCGYAPQNVWSQTPTDT